MTSLLPLPSRGRTGSVGAADLETMFLRSDVKHCFPSGKVGSALAAQALEAFDAASGSADREAVVQAASRASSYARRAYDRGAWFVDVDLSDWFALPALGFRELAVRQERAEAEWRAALAAKEGEEEEDEDEDPWDDEVDLHGRTLPWDEDGHRWLFSRFGRLPSDGRSRFGLAREDTEDGPDPWRQELGMTHEAGVCVFRCRRHPDVPGSVILVEPHFSLARYGVPSQAGHLLSVIPDGEEEPDVYLLSGTPCRVRGYDGSWRTDLGSDGEYMLDMRHPVRSQETSLDSVFVSADMSIRDFLVSRRGYTARPPL